MTHWADVVAARLIEGRPEAKHVFATAITPSGPIHVGNMREVLTTEAIFRATKDLGADAELIYIADDYDPLRKVYPFLHPSYQEHVGKPLREIPCPDEDGRPNGCGRHASYSEHFLEPFLGNLDELGVAPTVLSAHAMYTEGRYVENTLKAMDGSNDIRAIIEGVSKRQLPKSWAPFNPQCPCGRISDVTVLDYVKPIMRASCAACAEGSEDPDAGTFEVNLTEGGNGKLAWRIDWPARWDFLGVTFEAFGKDHGAKGGSWDTGKRIVRDVFDNVEPEHVMYEFLNLKGKGAMHSSTGLAVSASDMLRMTPPEVLRYLLVRQSPRKHIDFDPGLGLLGLVDEFDRLERVRFGVEENSGDLSEVERTYELSMPRGVPAHMPKPVNFRHLVTVAQVASDLDGVETILRRSGELEGELDATDRDRLAARVDHVRNWIRDNAPENVRFEVQKSMPKDLALDAAGLEFLRALAGALADCAWDPQAIHDAVHATAVAHELAQGAAFRAVYRAVLGQDRGPRAGFFLASLDQEFVVQRFAAV